MDTWQIFIGSVASLGTAGICALVALTWRNGTKLAAIEVDLRNGRHRMDVLESGQRRHSEKIGELDQRVTVVEGRKR